MLWKSMLRRALQMQDLLDYIKTDLPEPEEAEAKKTWSKERAKVAYIITTSLMDPRVQSRLLNNGYDMDEEDPKKIYDLVERVIPAVTRSNMASIFIEFTRLDRTKFDSLDAFVERAQSIVLRLTQLKKTLDDDLKIAILLHGLKTTYPTQHTFWERAFEEKTLTWDDLISELSRMGVHEKSNLSMAMINKNKSSQGGNQNNNDKTDKIKCDGCDNKIRKGWQHLSCGHHVPKDIKICYWCNPDKAPDSWPNKKKALELQRSGTTALAQHNSAGLLNPATTDNNGARPSMLLFSSNLSNLSLGEFPSFNNLLSDQDFHTSPQL
ncbi:hypothetical protein B0T18DRAFT_423538 [Schizothecium vesticola]|uniref:Uncharacterized protein n=1 Tax=Schizothecium vesticola TaxID=314040 RepID=A0AA40F877_9PEZI|nr:hypothetical protein B0T18DRAFT_423538 [Schizothecium vesticola]